MQYFFVSFSVKFGMDGLLFLLLLGLVGLGLCFFGVCGKFYSIEH